MNQLIERRQIHAHQSIQRLQIRIHLGRQIFVNHVRLRGRWIVGTLHRPHHVSQLVIELDREIQRIFAGAVFGLVEILFDGGQFRGQRLGRIGYALVIALGEFVQLLAHRANANHGVVCSGQLVADLQRQR